MSKDHPLRRWRKRNGISMDAFAADMGVAVATVSRWETGERIPESKYWARLKELTKGRVTIAHFPLPEEGAAA